MIIKKPRQFREKQMLEFIRGYMSTNGYPPSYQEIADELKLSRARICQIMRMLVKDKMIRRSKNRQRDLKFPKHI